MTRNEQWHIEGNAAELYERYAARYILGPWASGLIAIAGVRAGERVLDLACGTGAVARLAAKEVGASGRVTGLDLNAGMLSVARSLPAPSGGPLEWVERSALDTGLQSHSFDVVLCQQGVQFFPDKPAALREIQRVLVPGGRVAVSVWRSSGIYNSAVGDALRQHVGAEIASRFCASRDAPTGDELTALFVDAGFAAVKLRVERMIVRLPLPEDFVLGHLAATPVASNIRALDSVTRAAVSDHVTRELARYIDGDAIAFPEEINVVTGRGGVA
ncbi:MAG: Methyltransferase type 11 [Betaproteobacteria bacterium]|nr:Methyltransferase type 11 [Betaproteobacteria bacterium]